MANHLLEYWQAIQDGKIIVGTELRMLLAGLVYDLQNDRYRYETEEAHFRIEFMENLCLQNKKPFYNVPMALMLWQKAFIEVVYSFKKFSADEGRWIRRFQDVILLIARKNGKSTLLAADAHADLRIGDGGMDIVCTSNDDKQASLIWNEVDGMRRKIDPKSFWTHKNMTFIVNKKTDTKIFKLSSNTRNKDGRNIDKAYFDESHDALDDEIAAACQKSMSVKSEPLFINITTEGFVNDGYLDAKLSYSRKVLHGEIDDDTHLGWLYTQDSEQEIWQDERSWEKSNPSLGVIKKRDYLRQEIAKSKVDVSTRIHTLCKDFNIKQNNAQSWLMLEDYDYPQAEWSVEDFRGAFALGGVDLSATTDLSSAKIFMMKPGDKTKYIVSHYWICESKLEDSLDKEAGAKYLEWAKAGLLTIHEGNEIDISKIADWFADHCKTYKIKLYKCGYDQRYAKTFLDRMDAYGLECEMINQNRYTMSAPMKLVEADLKSRLINYGGHDIDKWCLGNTSIQMDGVGNIMPVKAKGQRSKRIDGAVSLIIAVEVFRRYRNEFMTWLGSG